MAKNKRKTCYVRGTVYYAKVLGSPVPTYDGDAKEWTVELALDKAGIKTFKDLGVGDRVKSKEKFLDGTPHFHFKQAERRKDGEFNRPIPVVDAAGNKWDESKLIGNGSKCDIKFDFIDFGPGKFPGVYIRGIRVLDLVEYESNSFPELDEDDEFFAKAQEAELEAKGDKEETEKEDENDVDHDDLDDDVPF